MYLFNQDLPKIQFILVGFCFICRYEQLKLVGTYVTWFSSLSLWKEKEQGWTRYQNTAAIPSGHTGCPITVLADIHWKLHASCSEQSLSTSQLHVRGAVVIPFYRWKRGGMKEIECPCPGPCSWQLTQAIWISGSCFCSCFLRKGTIFWWHQNRAHSSCIGIFCVFSLTILCHRASSGGG